MTTLSETLTLGLVLVLLFGSICLYLYTRIQQNEQKLNLVESLLIDLKMTTEIKSYPDLPAPVQQMASMPVVIEMGSVSGSAAGAPADVVPTGIEVVDLPEAVAAPTIEDSYKEAIKEALEGVSAAVAAASDSASVKVGANYPSLTLSELKALAKQRGISGASGMKRQQLIEVLQTADRAEENGAPPPMEPFLGGEIKTGE